MTDAEFDRALLGAAFSLAAERGWGRVSVGDAARRAAVPLDRARARFPVRALVLLRFGSLADQAALAEASPDGPARDRLFGLLMRRIDTLQAHREGVLALFRHLPTDPCMAAILVAANFRSMRWMLEGAGIEATGARGKLRTKGLLAVWLATVRAWRGDASADLSATMAALDRALRRAEQVEGWLAGRRPAGDAPPPAPAEPAPEPPADPAPGVEQDDPSQPD
jgi:hypothetical protein